MTTDPEAVEKAILLLTQYVRILRKETTNPTGRNYVVHVLSRLEKLLCIRIVDQKLYDDYVRLYGDDHLSRADEGTNHAEETRRVEVPGLLANQQPGGPQTKTV